MPRGYTSYPTLKDGSVKQVLSISPQRFGSAGTVLMIIFVRRFVQLGIQLFLFCRAILTLYLKSLGTVPLIKTSRWDRFCLNLQIKEKKNRTY